MFRRRRDSLTKPGSPMPGHENWSYSSRESSSGHKYGLATDALDHHSSPFANSYYLAPDMGGFALESETRASYARAFAAGGDNGHGVNCNDNSGRALGKTRSNPAGRAAFRLHEPVHRAASHAAGGTEDLMATLRQMRTTIRNSKNATRALTSSNQDESSQGEQRDMETLEHDFRNSTWMDPNADQALRSYETESRDGLWSKDYESLTASQFQAQINAHRPRKIREDLDLGRDHSSLLAVLRRGRPRVRKSPLLSPEEQAKLAHFRRFFAGVRPSALAAAALALRRAEAAASTHDEHGVAWQRENR